MSSQIKTQFRNVTEAARKLGRKAWKLNCRKALAQTAAQNADGSLRVPEQPLWQTTRKRPGMEPCAGGSGGVGGWGEGGGGRDGKCTLVAGNMVS